MKLKQNCKGTMTTAKNEVFVGGWVGLLGVGGGG